MPKYKRLHEGEPGVISMSKTRRRWTTWWRTETSFVSANGSKLGVSEGCVGRTMVGRTGRETDLADMIQEDVVYDGK